MRHCPTLSRLIHNTAPPKKTVANPSVNTSGGLMLGKHRQWGQEQQWPLRTSQMEAVSLPAPMFVELV